MKLQVKDSGAWRNVLTFAAERRAAVEESSAALLAARLGGRRADRYHHHGYRLPKRRGATTTFLGIEIMCRLFHEKWIDVVGRQKNRTFVLDRFELFRKRFEVNRKHGSNANDLLHGQIRLISFLAQSSQRRSNLNRNGSQAGCNVIWQANQWSNIFASPEPGFFNSLHAIFERFTRVIRGVKIAGQCLHCDPNSLPEIRHPHSHRSSRNNGQVELLAASLPLCVGSKVNSPDQGRDRSDSAYPRAPVRSCQLRPAYPFVTAEADSRAQDHHGPLVVPRLKPSSDVRKHSSSAKFGGDRTTTNPCEIAI